MENIQGISKGMSVAQVLRGLPPFQPLAYYDKHLDVIRVQMLDCSICEERLDHIMTIYHANHHPNSDGINDVVGFAIKGVRRLLMELGVVEKEGQVELAELLNKLFKKYPSQSTKFAVEYYHNNGITVEINNYAP